VRSKENTEYILSYQWTPGVDVRLKLKLRDLHVSQKKKLFVSQLLRTVVLSFEKNYLPVFESFVK
jgi:hypothetical protein